MSWEIIGHRHKIYEGKKNFEYCIFIVIKEDNTAVFADIKGYLLITEMVIIYKKERASS